ncbi:unnamed protein product [Paramecium primaurelia]|uniref:EGF-like domain-containing protein n=1 Tax=Paramecium primaurelia TaxID=5886 RepID=A0A8S1JQK4_PARPR|nr:unnamed protein product [Paramecium primaurelia]
MKYLLIFTILFYSIDCQKQQFTYRFSDGSKRKLEELKPNISEKKWEPLRIHFEYLSSNYNENYTSYITEILEMVSIFFYRFLLVRRMNEKITFKESYPKQFYGFQIKQSLMDQQYDADLVIFVNIENSTKFYKAYCGPTVYDELSLRPIIALMSWNINYTKIDKTNKIIYESNLESAIHEIIHGLGITYDYFSKYYDSVTGKNYENPNFYKQNNITYLSTPRLIKFARIYFNCSNLKGIQMEDNGGPGTSDFHFERLLLYNELMTGSQLTGNLLITDFTFQLLQDTGFYRISDYTPDQSQWGRNKGCKFVENYCNNNNFTEFCYQKNIESCSYERTGQSICMQEILGGQCMYQQIYTDQFCKNDQNQVQNKSSQIITYYGSDSICLDGSISPIESYQKFTCQKFKCDLNNKLKIIIGDLEFDCSQSGSIQIPNDFFGNLECPNNPENVCLFRNDCPNSCGLKGFCINKQCICSKGYSGLDCQQQCDDYRYQGSCLQNCPNLTYPLDIIKYCIGCPGNCLNCSNYNQCTKCKSGYLLREGFCDNLLLEKELDYQNPEYIDENNNPQSSDTNSAEIVISTNSNILMMCIILFMLLY